MDITSIGGQAASNWTTDRTLGKDEFLRLFVAQLRAQNPLSPMDSTEFTAQLAQFSSLEQLNNISRGTERLLISQLSLQNTLSAGLIGKDVRFDESGFHTVKGISFDEFGTSVILENGSKVLIGNILEIQGGN